MPQSGISSSATSPSANEDTNSNAESGHDAAEGVTRNSDTDGDARPSINEDVDKLPNASSKGPPDADDENDGMKAPASET